MKNIKEIIEKFDSETNKKTYVFKNSDKRSEKKNSKIKKKNIDIVWNSENKCFDSNQ